jgi:P4 family phage/plasmid primase-like protien
MPNNIKTTARLVASKLAESLITRAYARKLQLRPIVAKDVNKLPNIPKGPHNDGLIIKYFDETGKSLIVKDRETNEPIPMYRVRYLPPVGRDGFAAKVGIPQKEQKYTQPLRVGCPPYLSNLIDWVAVAKDPERELWITEGELKAIAAAIAGQATIGLGGVWNFKGQDRPLSDLFYRFNFENRRVVCVYDSDCVTNHNVRYACDSLARQLANLGASVFTLTIPALPKMKKVGLDDFLKHGARTPRKALEKLRTLVVRWEGTTMNDTRNTNLFVQLNRDRLFFARQEGAWRAWDGRLWVADRTHEARALTADVSAHLRLEADVLNDADARKTGRKWATQSGNENRRNAILNLAAAELVKDVDCLDTSPYLFNCQNGILDLATLKASRTCSLLPHEPSKFLGRISPVLYDPAARCPEFYRFLDKIIPKADVRQFLQRMAGYALTGLTGEQCFFIFYGLGRNGKSTFVEVLMYVWGDYARTANGDTFVAGRRVGTVRDDLHALRGSRLVKAVETAKNATLDEVTVKEHTGGDQVVTRALYGRQTQWSPTHKLILVTNEKPHIKGTDDAIWSRVRTVPFDVFIPEAERIADYFENKLKPEAGGILNWALEGLRQYYKTGLAAPEEVLTATQEYREDENVVVQFLNAMCVTDPKAQPTPDGSTRWSTPEQLQTAFKTYCMDQGIPYRGTNLKNHLEQMGYQQERGHQNRYWRGIKVTRLPSML